LGTLLINTNIQGCTLHTILVASTQESAKEEISFKGRGYKIHIVIGYATISSPCGYTRLRATSLR
jgi:hypothetical protein